jgi:hypothetical protein
LNQATRVNVQSDGRRVASYVLEGLGKRARVVPLGMGPTMNACTDGPMDTAANDAWAGIIRDTRTCMAMTLRLADDETEALRRRAELEQRSMQEVARQAIREYVENHSRAELLDQVLDEELPRYAEALERLGQ